MSPSLHHECTRVPVTALATCGPLLVAAEGPFLRFYHAKDSRYLCSREIFKAQSVHGLSVYSETSDAVVLLIWGGWLVRALEIKISISKDENHFSQVAFYPSRTVKAPDWILYLEPQPPATEDFSGCRKRLCAAVTAHNALLEVVVEPNEDSFASTNSLALSISELTSSSRSILYSAHLLWESHNTVLVAAGTAFGEIIYWSWTRYSSAESASRIHQVFLGHEGSIFGVQISKQLRPSLNLPFKRLLASCSDDRTIRIWDVSEFSTDRDAVLALDENLDGQRTRHTGFSNAEFDLDLSSSTCVAIGWGHVSRVWAVQFLDISPSKELHLLSSGEDATSRIWKLNANLKPGPGSGYNLILSSSADYNNGKNIWSTVVQNLAAGLHRVICGAADSKLTSYHVQGTSQPEDDGGATVASEYTVRDVLSMEDVSREDADAVTPKSTHKSSKVAEFFRSYAFLDEYSFLLTTNSGKVYLETLHSGPTSFGRISSSKLVSQLDELTGYSVCAGDSTLGVAFIAGSRGSIYIYSRRKSMLSKIQIINGKVGDMFIAKASNDRGPETLVLLVTLLGKNVAYLLYVDYAAERAENVFRSVSVPISEMLTGIAITSMAFISTAHKHDYLILGFRRGSVVIYGLPGGDQGQNEGTGTEAPLKKIINQVHGHETVTTLSWNPSSTNFSSGHLLSLGRDGHIAVHLIDLAANSALLVHYLTLPIGPNIEGLHFHQDHLLVHGFSSKKWVLYDVTAEEEVMSMETGGSHRSWVFQPYETLEGGGTLVWTRASSMHICSQKSSNHQVIRSGEHGREIKAVAVSPLIDFSGQRRKLIATGAEDTDIKIFEYIDGDFACRRTLRKHTTGIQHLQWSRDGDYLFSSGGCEEFYIWRVGQLPSFLRIGIVCEFVYPPESEYSDLRVMSFDVTQHDSCFIIAMVYSDSSIKVYEYSPKAIMKWRPLAKGMYFTSCLTQCVFLSPASLLTAGTDGHAVVWPIQAEMSTTNESTTESGSSLLWKHPVRIHQNTSKTLAQCALAKGMTLLISGGDDGSLAFLCANSSFHSPLSSPGDYYAYPPMIVARTHASAVTACAAFTLQSRILVLTSGNDQWVRLWEVIPHIVDVAMNDGKGAQLNKDALSIERVGKIKTNVADVSGMAVLQAAEGCARVLVCGVGMELIRVGWE